MINMEDCISITHPFKVVLNGKWGFIDETGREICPCKYDWVYDFCEGLAKVKLNGKWGFIDTSGREICPIKYDGIGYFYKELSVVKLNNKWGCIDTTGREVCPCIFDFVYITHYRAVVNLNTHWGGIGYSGDYILPCLFDNVSIDDEIMFATKLAMEYTFDLSGECIGAQALPYDIAAGKPTSLDVG